MNPEVLIDARNQEPPGPLYAALDALAVLEPGQYLHFRIHREPLMLFPQLDGGGFDYYAVGEADDNWHILIWRRGDSVAASGARHCERDIAGAAP